MATRIIKSTLAAVGCVVLVVAGIYAFRNSLLQAGINLLLEGDLAVTSLEGVQLGTRHASIDGIEVTLDAAGQQLSIADIDVDFSLRGLFSAPIVENLVIGSARLTAPAEAPEDRNPPAATANRTGATADSQHDSALALGDLLQQLRTFPLKNVVIRDLELPQFRQKLALNLKQQAGLLQFNVASGALQLLATFAQQSADAAAQFTLILQADETTVAEMALSLQPQVGGYTLTGNGAVEFSDTNTPFAEYLTKPLPVSSVAVQWDIAADITDELRNNPASNINVGVLPASTFVLRSGLASGLGELAVTIPERAQVSLKPGAGLHISAGRIPLSLAGSWQQQVFESAVTLTPADCRPGARQCTAGFNGTATLAAYATAGVDPTAAVTIDALEFSGIGNATLDGELIELQLDAGSRLGSSAVTGPAYTMASIDVATESVVDVSSSLVERQLTITADDISLAIAELKVGEYQASPALSLQNIELKAAEKLAGIMTVQTAALEVSGPHWIPAMGFAADIGIDGSKLAFSTPLLLPNAPAEAQLQASGAYDSAAGTGQLNMQMPGLTLSGEGNSLSSYLGGWPYPADVMTGTLALEVNVQLQPAETEPNAASALAITGNTKIGLMDVAGFYEEYFFRGLNTIVDGAYDSSAPTLPVTTPPLSLTVDEINVGMPITDFALDYRLDARSQIATINSISGQLLDGTVSGMDINYDFGKERNEMTLMFEGLRLERMLELSEYEGIEAIGAVSGELPITITAGKVEVDAGKLFAEAPGGSIRYLNAPPAGQGNPAMDLVNQALSNYQFQSLESTIDYSPDGELLLGMQLRGHNPDMNGGQAINLNLNISDNIPQLLRSLQAGRAIEDFLQEQYK